MATFEDIKLIFQAHQNLVNLQRDMRGNAQAYKDAVTAGKLVGAIVAVMTANTNQYLTRLQWSADAWADLTTRAKVQSGLSALSIPQSELTGLYGILKDAADAEEAAENAGITTNGELDDAADATLANVPAIASIWPNG